MFYGAQMNWKRKHETLKFMAAYVNDVLVEKWEVLNSSSASITNSTSYPSPHLAKMQTFKISLWMLNKYEI